MTFDEPEEGGKTKDLDNHGTVVGATQFDDCVFGSVAFNGTRLYKHRSGLKLENLEQLLWIILHLNWIGFMVQVVVLMLTDFILIKRRKVACYLGTEQI